MGVVDEIILTPLKIMSVPGGDVLHAIKNSDPGFIGFGEAYFSLINFGCIKGWKRHLRMTLNLVVPIGRVRFVFTDGHEGLREEVVGLDRYMRITVPPGIWCGFEGLSAPHSLIMNIADIQHDPNEIERKELDKILYKWGKKK